MKKAIISIFLLCYEIIKDLVIVFSDGPLGFAMIFFDFLNIEHNKENRSLLLKGVLLFFIISALFVAIALIGWLFGKLGDTIPISLTNDVPVCMID